jgi:sulfate adenylyltransferase subunit 2
MNALEAEFIEIIREAVATTRNPVMMYSIGKDSPVMLHMARKAFYPAPPFPLLHVDTKWKFQAMYAHRARMVEESGMKLISHTNPEVRLLTVKHSLQDCVAQVLAVLNRTL